jgi:protein-S-isoprenylcysteine O-methyltransferase Ste14
MWLTLARIAAFVLTVALWRWSLQLPPSPLVNVFCIVLTVSAVFPVVWAGRRLLDANPTVERAARVTTVVHAALMMLFGIAIVKAVQTGDTWRGLVIPVPPRLGTVLVYVTGAVTLLTVGNLALRGLGAPFSIALSRRLATDWLYARTRNPMVLAVLACLVAIGLKLQSALFVVWVGALVAPAWIAFLRIYEERELEIRFREEYMTYRDSTPFLWSAGSRSRRHDG